MANALERLGELRFADLLTFLAVKQCSSITGAARELQVTPSQVSKAVARLEEQLQIKLLARSSRGVSVSDGAQRIIPQLEEVVARVRELAKIDAPGSPELTVAAPSYLHGVFLPAIARDLPEMRLRALQLPPALIRAYATENFFDMALTAGVEKLPGAWVSEPIGELRKGLFAGVALARKLGAGPHTAAQVQSIPFITPIYNVNGQFIPVDDGCPLVHGERKLGHQAQTIFLGLELAVHSQQLVFGPVVAARQHLERGLLVEIPVEGWRVTDTLYVTCNVDRVLARVQTTILRSLRDALAAPEA